MRFVKFNIGSILPWRYCQIIFFLNNEINEIFFYTNFRDILGEKCVKRTS